MVQTWPYCSCPIIQATFLKSPYSFSIICNMSEQTGGFSYRILLSSLMIIGTRVRIEIP